VPALGQYLPGFEALFWTGVCAPKNTQVEVVELLNRQINAALLDSAVAARFAELGTTVFPPGSPNQFAQFIRKETEKWGEVVRAAGMRAD
jgi:tripartite-type tricarboxylate transporter receptor subunit TctC